MTVVLSCYEAGQLGCERPAPAVGDWWPGTMLMLVLAAVVAVVAAWAVRP